MLLILVADHFSFLKNCTPNPVINDSLCLNLHLSHIGHLGHIPFSGEASFKLLSDLRVPGSFLWESVQTSHCHDKMPEKNQLTLQQEKKKSFLLTTSDGSVLVFGLVMAYQVYSLHDYQETKRKGWALQIPFKTTLLVIWLPLTLSHFSKVLPCCINTTNWWSKHADKSWGGGIPRSNHGNVLVSFHDWQKSMNVRTPLECSEISREFDPILHSRFFLVNFILSYPKTLTTTPGQRFMPLYLNISVTSMNDFSNPTCLKHTWYHSWYSIVFKSKNITPCLW